LGKLRRVIDRREFNETFQLFDRGTIVEIIDIFLSEYEGRFATLRKNVAERDFQALKLSAHSFKGVVANFKDPLTTSLSVRMDQMARQEIIPGLDEAFREMEIQASLLKEELEALRRDLISS
jgi:HPt (histidine-containing phosphotransfer) domain-containing protein